MLLSLALRRFRKEFNLTQKQVADAGNVSVRAYQTYEANERFPNVENIIAIADYYGISLDYLVGRTDSLSTVERERMEKSRLKQSVFDASRSALVSADFSDAQTNAIASAITKAFEAFEQNKYVANNSAVNK